VQQTDGFQGCKFSGLTIGPNETVSIKTDPESSASKILRVKFVDSSIHSVPAEVFQKFSNLIVLDVDGNNVQEIKPNTYLHAEKFEFLTSKCFQRSAKFAPNHFCKEQIQISASGNIFKLQKLGAFGLDREHLH
jgi:hypothetical protein